MANNLPIRMKKTTKATRPSDNVVLKSCTDSDLARYIRDIAKFPALSTEEEREIAKRVKAGDEEAKKTLIQANLKLVISVAKKAIHMSALPLIDLIQEGNLGLMVAVEKYNWKLGYKFQTYATWWIKQAMFKAISEQSHSMKIPVYIQETLSKFSKIKAEMEKRYNCQVKNKDVAEKMNISPDKLDTFLSAYSKTISIEGSMECQNGKEMNVADILEDTKTDVMAAVEAENLKRDLEAVIATLKEREQEVVRMRYGLGNISKRTLEEIGNIYGVTKECIRQTELRALKNMRNNKLLSCYAE
ncbi:MAG: RNA polymerase sigma factor RpoD/SigA [Cyanobacteria bacterium RUI128]|nr:RNA polymerase sigma factor RpoD/SigA [Cyanobacteria bacterium RUI128]